MVLYKTYPDFYFVFYNTYLDVLIVESYNFSASLLVYEDVTSTEATVFIAIFLNRDFYYKEVGDEL